MKEKVSGRIGALVSIFNLRCLQYLKGYPSVLDVKIRQNDKENLLETVKKVDARGRERYLPVLMNILFAYMSPLED